MLENVRHGIKDSFLYSIIQFIFLPEITPKIVITENPEAGVLAQKLNK